MSELTAASELVGAAARGDKGAWDLIVKRYLPLVYSVIATFRLSRSDAQDVNQTVWLRLVEHLDDLRDPRALPGWISVTTRNEALRVIKTRGRTIQVDPTSRELDVQPPSASIDDHLLRSERRQVLRDALSELPQKQRELLLLLVADPPISYREISERLGIPVGSIGPTRSRYLNRLRGTSALKAFLESDVNTNQIGG